MATRPLLSLAWSPTMSQRPPRRIGVPVSAISWAFVRPPLRIPPRRLSSPAWPTRPASRPWRRSWPRTAPPPETTAVTARRPDFTLTEKIRDKVGHETDYSWITGQLFFVRADGGRWVLRYGQADEVDKYGGGVVLEAPDRRDAELPRRRFGLCLRPGGGGGPSFLIAGRPAGIG